MSSADFRQVTLRVLLLVSVALSSAGGAFAQAQGGPKAATQPIYVRLRLDGLYPRSISAIQGPAEIVFTNPTFLAVFDVVLIEKAQGRALGQTTATRGKFRNRQALKLSLTPGVYTIQVVGHPEWASTLTVNPKGK